jgi:hypothetical protein
VTFSTAVSVIHVPLEESTSSIVLSCPAYLFTSGLLPRCPLPSPPSRSPNLLTNPEQLLFPLVYRRHKLLRRSTSSASLLARTAAEAHPSEANHSLPLLVSDSRLLLGCTVLELRLSDSTELMIPPSKEQPTQDVQLLVKAHTFRSTPNPLAAACRETSAHGPGKGVAVPAQRHG